ncbi:NAD-dependent epimerase/dehydratase [Parafrankia sp. EAN1pec]|uniref:dTDP-glucose 4,6-dehydratase n=1 Tax=Parafrankia sp. (strain EAN1pec) TaxID=298653 RepID=UPI0000542D21|nr:NAD-dependent epimerase/dehydratase [Frankia sp. EAN1pec]
MRLRNVLVTGGAGFIGSHLVVRLISNPTVEKVTVLDALTYAGHRDNLAPVAASPKLEFVEGNILDADLLASLMDGQDGVAHLAAESHVDRSFLEAGNFLLTNVLGTQRVLDAALAAGVRRIVHVSTDEVYGSWPSGAATEVDPVRPTFPYSASKAASDLATLAHFRSYGTPVSVTRSSNCYGPAQHPEKIIPLFVTRLLQGLEVSLHGHGQHLRNWLHVEDNCAGIELVLRGGQPGEIYNLGGGTDLTTHQLTALLLELCGADWSAVSYVPDRTANDYRYSMDSSKAMSVLGYRPVRGLRESLVETVQWYRDHPDRWGPGTRNAAAPLAQVEVSTLTTTAHE